MWIDRVIELEPRRKMVAVKAVSLSEEHLHAHFAGDSARGLGALPVMPACFIIEGMAQTAGILVGHANGFREKVVLAKVSRAELSLDAGPADVLRYTAEIERLDDTGAATRGRVERLRVGADGAMHAREAGSIDLMFSHLDRNISGMEFPEHNFVFGEGFRTILRTSGFAD